MMTLSTPRRSVARGLLAPFACALMAGTGRRADVTYERLVNPEPQNWLTSITTTPAQRYSALDTINKSNVKNLKLAVRGRRSAAPRTTRASRRRRWSTTASCTWWTAGAWCTKIDVRSGTSGPILWQMNPKLERQDRNRGLALWNNLVISVTGYDGPGDRDR